MAATSDAGGKSMPAGAARRLPWWGLVALAAVYFGAARLGLSLAFLAPHVSPVWPPTGIALAAVLVFGFRVWPAIAAGAFLANVAAEAPLATAAGIAAGNTLEALAGGWLLQRVAGFRVALDRVRDVLALALLAAGLSTAVSATLGVTSLCLGGVEPWSRFGTLWAVWWLGDAMGDLVVAPALLVWFADRDPGWPRRHPIELAALLAAVAAVGVAVFAAPAGALPPLSPLAYTVFPFLIWAALRFGPPGAALVTVITSVVAVLGALGGAAAFPDGVAATLDVGAAHRELVLLQAFMAVVAITGLFLAATVAERNRVERELHRRADDLAAADRRKDTFLAMLGHELRNPLAPIVTGLQLLRDRGARGAEAERLVGMLERQAGHLTRLVDDLLDVSRITRGDITLRRAPVDLRVVVDEALQQVRPLLDRSERRLTADLPAAPLVVEGDSDRLQQAITNLLHNAAKYTEAGGHVRVSAKREGDAAVVRVEDDGAGIAPELLPRVFDLFARGERPVDRARGGLGIGLTLVLRIVELHGGRVEASSSGPGRGSEFTVRLPAAPRAVPAAPPAPAAAAPASPLHVLVVDDHVDAAESLGELMRLAGHGAEVVHDGPAALAAADRRPPDVVLLDLGLPGMDGYEIARRLRGRSEMRRALLVAVTGFGQEQDRRRSHQAGIDHHLVKPADPSVLRRLIAAWAARRTESVEEGEPAEATRGPADLH